MSRGSNDLGSIFTLPELKRLVIAPLGGFIDVLSEPDLHQEVVVSLPWLEVGSGRGEIPRECHEPGACAGSVPAAELAAFGGLGVHRRADGDNALDLEAEKTWSVSVC